MYDGEAVVLGTDSVANLQVVRRHGAATRLKHALRRWETLMARVEANKVKLVHVGDARRGLGALEGAPRKVPELGLLRLLPGRALQDLVVAGSTPDPHVTFLRTLGDPRYRLSLRLSWGCDLLGCAFVDALRDGRVGYRALA